MRIDIISRLPGEAQAARTAGLTESVTALKAIGLLFAAGLRAKALGNWSSSGEYYPRDDLLKLQPFAKTKLGPIRGPSHAVTLFWNGVADTLHILGEPAA